MFNLPPSVSPLTNQGIVSYKSWILHWKLLKPRLKENLQIILKESKIGLHKEGNPFSEESSWKEILFNRTRQIQMELSFCKMLVIPLVKKVTSVMCFQIIETLNKNSVKDYLIHIF